MVAYPKNAKARLLRKMGVSTSGSRAFDVIPAEVQNEVVAHCKTVLVTPLTAMLAVPALLGDKPSMVLLTGKLFDLKTTIMDMVDSDMAALIDISLAAYPTATLSINLKTAINALK